jgi:hypothetical protein
VLVILDPEAIANLLAFDHDSVPDRGVAWRAGTLAR